MRKRLAVLLVFAASLLSLPACSDGPSEPPSYSATGNWSGVSDGVAFSLNLTQSSTNAVTGTGSIGGGGTVLPITVTGSVSSPNLTLTISATGFAPLTLTGEFENASTIEGTLTGSGFTGESITLHK